MKRSLLPIALLSFTSLSAQIQNGGFEQLNSQSMPAYWQGNLFLWPITIDSTGEEHADSVVFDVGNYVLTADAHSGQQAIELRNGYNFTQEAPIVGSWSASDDSAAYLGFPLVFVGVPLQPIMLEFYAKYLPLQGDSGFVQMDVYNGSLDIIGHGELAIVGTYADYAFFQMPVSYATADPAVFYSLTFSTARYGGQATFGTRFLIDDVNLALSPLSVSDHLSDAVNVEVVPNPAQDVLRFSLPPGTMIRSCQVLDAAGRDQRVIVHADGTCDISGLSSGVYMARVQTNDGMAHTRFVKR